MSKGRFMLGVGPGGLMSDFELFKLTDHNARNRMVVEAVDMIEKIWSQDPPYDLKGEFWNISIKDGIVPSSASATCRSPTSSRGRRSTSRWRARTRRRPRPRRRRAGA